MVEGDQHPWLGPAVHDSRPDALHPRCPTARVRSVQPCPRSSWRPSS